MTLDSFFDSTTNSVTPARAGSPIVRQVVGAIVESLLIVVLLWASLSKLIGSSVHLGSVVSGVRGISLGRDALIAAFELGLAAWLLSGRARRGAWWTVVAFFAATSLYGIFQYSLGQTSCNCFGKGTSRSMALGVSFICLAAAFVTRRSWTADRVEKVSHLASYAAIGFALAVVVFQGASGSDWGRVVRDGRVDFKPLVASVSIDLFHGRPSLFPAIVVNQSTSTPVQIIGISSELGIPVACRQLPLTLAPGETANLEIQLILREMPAEAKLESIRLWNANPATSMIGNRIFLPLDLELSQRQQVGGRCVVELVPSPESVREYEATWPGASEF